MSFSSPSRGFTLIEALVYLALYSLVMGGFLTALYAITESGERNRSIAILEEEGNFVLAKIEWQIARSRSVEEPASEGGTLSLLLENGARAAADLRGGYVRLREGGGAFRPLNNPDTAASGLRFEHVRASAYGAPIEGVDVSFALHATTSQGLPIERAFSSRSYLMQ